MALSHTRSRNEIRHGRLLAGADTEAVWGWGTPAGRLRARRRGRMIAGAGGLMPGKKCLEIGCGTGLFTGMFAETGARIVAMDLSSDLLAKARQRHLPRDRVTFVQSRFEDGALKGPFDAVIGSSVLHHLALAPALEMIHRLLKSGGRLVFAEPNYINPQIFFTYKLRRWFPYISPDEDAFYPWRLRSDLQRAGFGAVRITPFDWLHPKTPRPFLGTVSRAGAVLETLPVVRELAGSLLISGRKG